MVEENLQGEMTESLQKAEELWEGGELRSAGKVLEEMLERARANPYKVKFRTRIQLATMLAGLYLATDQVENARQLISEESLYARDMFQFIQVKGTVGQKRAATGDYIQLCDLEKKISLIGREAPEIEISKWINSDPLSLAALRGRVVLMEFWATWCKPCEEMIPTLTQFNEEYGARGLVILALTRHYLAYEGGAEEKAKEVALVQGYVDQHGIKYPVGIAEDEREQELYGANGLPSLVLVDRKGIVRYAYGNGEDEQFKRLLDECLNQ